MLCTERRAFMNTGLRFRSGTGHSGLGRIAPKCTDDREIPAVSEWGIVIMALLLLAGAKIHFSRRETLAQVESSLDGLCTCELEQERDP